MATFTPDTLEFLMVSFEGPDPYSLAGGLGVRVREFCSAAAGLGFRTTLAFVGDPWRPAEEEHANGLRMIRWCQPTSRRYPVGVYQGEDEKCFDLEATLPERLIEAVIAPAVYEGRVVVVMAEEWQTAQFTTRLSYQLHRRGLRDRCVLLWNANNSYGFERINWGELGYVAEITTVSGYMRHLMWRWGVNPLVVPNGVPEAVFTDVDPTGVEDIRAAAQTPCLGVKVARFCPEKRWHQAVDAIAILRERDVPARLLMHGGLEPFGGEVMAHCDARGLEVSHDPRPVRHAGDVAAALDESSAPIVNLLSFIGQPLIFTVFAAADVVLANSRHEPFGMVGLEAMAAGGVAVVGVTGEEYARPYVNAVAVRSDAGSEVAAAVQSLHEQPTLAARLRRNARRDAANLTWPRVIEGLVARLSYIGEHQRVVLPSSAVS